MSAGAIRRLDEWLPLRGPVHGHRAQDRTRLTRPPGIMIPLRREPCPRWQRGRPYPDVLWGAAVVDVLWGDGRPRDRRGSGAEMRGGARVPATEAVTPRMFHAVAGSPDALDCHREAESASDREQTCHHRQAAARAPASQRDGSSRPRRRIGTSLDHAAAAILETRRSRPKHIPSGCQRAERLSADLCPAASGRAPAAPGEGPLDPIERPAAIRERSAAPEQVVGPGPIAPAPDQPWRALKRRLVLLIT